MGNIILVGGELERKRRAGNIQWLSGTNHNQGTAATKSDQLDLRQQNIKLPPF